MNSKTLKVLLSILVVAIIALLVFSSISNKLLFIVILFVGYTVMAGVLFSGNTKNVYTKKFTQIYRLMIIPLLILLLASGIMLEMLTDKELAYNIFLIVLYCNLAGFSIPIFYRIIKKSKEH